MYRQITPATNYSLGSNTSSGSRRRSARRRASATRCPARSTRSRSTSRTASRNVAGRLPLPRRAQPVRHPEHPDAGDARLVAPRLGLLERRGLPLERRQREEASTRASRSTSRTRRWRATSRGTRPTSTSRRTSRSPGSGTTSLALHAGGGFAGGNRGGNGPFYVGGFVDLPVVNVVQNSLIQGGIQLRGYPVVAEAGNYYALFNAEYRFPIVNVDRGPSTLPSSSTASAARLRRRRQRVRRPDAGAVQDGRRRRAVVRHDARLRPELHLSRRLRERASRTGGIDKTYFVAAVPF